MTDFEDQNYTIEMEEMGCPYAKYALRNEIPMFTLGEFNASNLIYNSMDNTLVDADLNCASDKLVKDTATEGPSGHADTYPQASTSTNALNLAAGQDRTSLVMSPTNVRKLVVSVAEMEEGCELELRSTTSLDASRESVEHNLIDQTKTRLNNSLVAGGRFAMDLHLPSDVSLSTSTTQNEVETETPTQVNQVESSDRSVPNLEEKAKIKVRVSMKRGSEMHPKNRCVLKEAAKIETLQGPQKRGRGGPPKIKSVLKEDAKIKNLKGPQKRGRGRPPKDRSVVIVDRKNKTRKVVLRTLLARACKPIHNNKNCPDCIKPVLGNRLRKTCPTCNMQANCIKLHRALHSYDCRIVLTKLDARNNPLIMQDCQLRNAITSI